MCTGRELLGTFLQKVAEIILQAISSYPQHLVHLKLVTITSLYGHEDISSESTVMQHFDQSSCPL